MFHGDENMPAGAFIAAKKGAKITFSTNMSKFLVLRGFPESRYSLKCRIRS